MYIFEEPFLFVVTQVILISYGPIKRLDTSRTLCLLIGFVDPLHRVERKQYAVDLKQTPILRSHRFIFGAT